MYIDPRTGSVSPAVEAKSTKRRPVLRLRRQQCVELLVASRAVRTERMLRQIERRHPSLLEGVMPNERLERVRWCVHRADERRFTRWSDAKTLVSLLLYFGPGLLEVEAVTRVLDDETIPRERRLDTLLGRLEPPAWAALLAHTRETPWPES